MKDEENLAMIVKFVKYLIDNMGSDETKICPLNHSIA